MTSTETRLPNRGEVADLLLPTVRRLCKEQGFRFIPKGKSKHPKLYSPDGERWCPLPTTLFDGPVRYVYMANLRKIGADLSFPEAESVIPAGQSADMTTTYEPTDSPWTDAEWRELQGKSDAWWRRRLFSAPEGVSSGDETQVAVQAAAQHSEWFDGFMARLEASTQPKRDAQGDRWTLGQARQLLRDGYSLAHASRITGWGAMWLEDLVTEQGDAR